MRGVNCIHRDQVRDKFWLYSRNRIIEKKKKHRLYKEREVFAIRVLCSFGSLAIVVRVKVERRLRIKKEQHDSM